MLRTLSNVVYDAQTEGKPVSICGEMASDPSAAVLLMSIGFDSLWMNATNLRKVKGLLRQISLSKTKDLLDAAMRHSQRDLRNLGRMINPASDIQA